ncbi:hypothetical protein AMECASPLE_036748 [Ameca splendens]|uniref:Uncharacterized protein n=1 Tax=Ameca splendens TaxID=208324 RepID=A0ABV1AGR9_9TELE
MNIVGITVLLKSSKDSMYPQSYHPFFLINTDLKITVKSTLLKYMQNVAWHCLAENEQDVPEKDVAWMAADVASEPDVPFTTNAAFTDVPVTHDAMGTNTPPYQHRCWL